MSRTLPHSKRRSTGKAVGSDPSDSDPYRPADPNGGDPSRIRLEDLRKTAFEAARVGTIGIDLNAGEIVADEGAREILGLSGASPSPLEEALRVLHPDEVPEAREALARAAERNMPQDFERELRVLRADGTQRWALVCGRVIVEERGGLPERRLVGLVLDVTERKQAETQFLRIVEAAPSGLVLVDAKGEIELANPEAERAFGYARGELVGRPVESLVPEVARSRHGDWRSAYLRHPSTRPMGAGRDLYGRRKDGSEFPVEIGLTPVDSVDGPVILATVVDITERKRAEARFLQIVEAAPSGLVLVNRQGTIELVNPQAEHAFGYGPGELIGQPVETLVPERARGQHGDWRRFYLDQPSARPMGAGRDLFGRRKDGSEFPVEIGLTPVEAAEGTMVLATVVDITERKRHEWSQAFLLRLESEVQQHDDPETIALAALRAVCGYLNASRCLFAGYDRRASYGVIHYEYDDDAQPLAADFSFSEIVPQGMLHAQLKGEPQVIHDVTSDSGTTGLTEAFKRMGVASYVAVPFVQAGEWLAALIVHDDAPRNWREDEVRVAREALQRVWPRILQAQTVRTLRESEVRLRLASELAGLGVFEWDVESDHSLWQNDRMYEIFGHMREDGTLSMAAFFERYLHPDDAASFEESLSAAMQPDRKLHVVCRVRRKDGQLRWLEISGNFEIARDGTPIRLMGVLGDITERRKAEESLKRLTDTLEERVRERTHELKAANRKLQQRNRELQDFAYVASHDLKEPLRKISTFAELTLEDYGDLIDEAGHTYLKRMQSAAIRMSRLLDDLLQFSRIETQGQPFAQTRLDDTLREVVSDLEILIKESKTHLDVGPLPEIEADPSQMRQLFQNLIQNAIKFRRPTHPPSVTVRSESVQPNRRSRSMVRITVQDNGIGFEQKYAERIFSPFKRLHAPNTYEGMGMGLAICRRIVERHGGDVSARSLPDHGTTVTILLPRRQGPGPRIRPESPERPPRARPSDDIDGPGA